MPTLNQILANPELYNERNCYGFIDWFCKKEKLEKRFKSFLPKLKWLVKHGIVDGNKCSVSFKNVCPVNGKTYDIVHFVSVNNSLEFISYGGICPKHGFFDCDLKSEFWSYGKKPKAKNFKNWKEMKQYLKENKVKIV